MPCMSLSSGTLASVGRLAGRDAGMVGPADDDVLQRIELVPGIDDGIGHGKKGKDSPDKTALI